MTRELIGYAQHFDHHSYPVYETRKGNYFWRCLDCGEVLFFADQNKVNCTHKLEWKPTKTRKHLYYSCPICRIRGFRPIENDNL